MKPLREKIRYYHREFDGLIGRLFSHQEPLAIMDRSKSIVFDPPHNNDLTYSRKDHFQYFNLMQVHETQNPSTCDLKVYQDLFVYSFIVNNLHQGAKILEIGGGESRVIADLKNNYEFWNLDKLEGQGHGPKNLFSTDGFVLVRENIGNFSKNLPDNYFDLIFSISVVEHFPEDEKVLSDILADMSRLLNQGGFSLHCIDSLLFKDRIWFHPFVYQALDLMDNFNIELLTTHILKDNKIWCLPKYAYYTRWFSKTHKFFMDFGAPFSLNLLWQNSGS